MNFNIVLNGSHNDNRIARISNALKVRNAEAAEKVTSRPLPKYVEGYSQSIIWGVRSLGIDPTSGREILLTRDGNVLSTGMPSIRYLWEIPNLHCKEHFQPTSTGRD